MLLIIHREGRIKECYDYQKDDDKYDIEGYQVGRPRYVCIVKPLPNTEHLEYQ